MASEVELSTPTRMHIGLLSHDDPRHGESWTGGDSDNFVTTSEEDSFDSEDMEEDTRFRASDFLQPYTGLSWPKGDAAIASGDDEYSHRIHVC